MNKSLKDQLSYIFVLKEKRLIKFEQGDLVSYILRNNGHLYVAIPYSAKKINESFVGMTICTEVINYEQQAVNCLCLVAEESVDSEKFLLIAEDFAKKDNRPTILSNPYNWIDKWRLIFGDALSNKKVYDVLGELISLKALYSEDKSFVWEGPKGGTHDLVGMSYIVEVKSTIKKKSYNVTINSSYQLSTEKPTSLYLVRLEKKPYCLSINSIVKELVEIGYQSEDLESLLEKQGYKKGNRYRDESYDLLEISKYSIDKNTFPVFKLEDMNNKFAPCKNIVGFTIELDLSGVKHDPIYKKE